ncbi:MAG: ABC transporter permease, partial [Bacteroidota bacterium]|nr:ABC transporter permease [Bacteroidota bacterium]
GKIMFQHLIPIIKKEFRHIRRDKRVLAILTFVPMGLLILNGYALNYDVNHIRLGVYDQEKSERSREFINSFMTSGYFDFVRNLTSSEQATQMIDDGDIRAALVIPPDFSHKILSNDPVDVQILVDGMDANAATTIIGYAQVITLEYSQKIVLTELAKMGRGNYVPIQYDARIWYNPELKSAKFLVPGLIGFILAITSIIATSLSIVKEKELNTMEQIDVSPIKPIELIVGKMVPYALISLVAAALVLVTGYFLFGVVIKGNYFYLFCATLLFIISGLSIGLFVSTIADSQQVAFQLAALLSMLPTIILSGFMFPIRSMPWWLQILTNISPAKFYLIILRSIVLKGVGLSAFWDQIVYLMIFISVVLLISVRRFKKTIG